MITNETVEDESRQVVFSSCKGFQIFQGVKGIRTIPIVLMFYFHFFSG